MRRTTKSKKNSIIAMVLTATVVLSGCTSMKNVIEKDNDSEIAPSKEKLNDNNEDETVNKNEASVKDLEMSEEQESLLKDAESQSAQDAIDFNETNLSVKTELNINEVPIEKDKYTDETEATKYFSYILFQYHAALIDGETFYKKIKPHLSNEFIDILPEKESERIAMFKSLQQVFSEQIEADIEKYSMTGFDYNGMTNEGVFLRKYTLYNGKTIFYQTLLKKVDGYWKIANDEPSVGYVTQDPKQKEFKDVFIQGKDKE
ncbi:hypothetical protein [Lysinibacillus fusiformis]|uniref:hypothetical protein n=1 Tax=Lysinibacillus fusiformis TaxID=28031 RepID=UPI0018815AB7|nr:hypothetical protein [Lysinibacillus fusiformis]MBD8523776.1 hypothetical protein [Lysinibacillus fusiformis]